MQILTNQFLHLPNYEETSLPSVTVLNCPNTKTPFIIQAVRGGAGRQSVVVLPKSSCWQMIIKTEERLCVLFLSFNNDPRQFEKQWTTRRPRMGDEK